MEINEYLLRFFQIVKEMENLDFFSGVSKLSRTEFRMLREIVMEEEKGKKIISSELARRLGITRSAVSQIVTKLEKRGVVQRVDSPIDHKIAYVCLSDSAVAVFEEQCREANEIMERVVNELGEEKLKRLFSSYEEFCRAAMRVQNERRGEGTDGADGAQS